MPLWEAPDFKSAGPQGWSASGVVASGVLRRKELLADEQRRERRRRDRDDMTLGNDSRAEINSLSDDRDAHLAGRSLAKARLIIDSAAGEGEHEMHRAASRI